MDRFSLDQSAARAWLTDLIEGNAPRVVLHELHPYWTLDSSWLAPNTVVTLIEAAQHYGHLSEPTGAKAVLSITGEDRYALTIDVPYGDQGQSFKLKSPEEPYVQSFTEDFSPNIALGAYGDSAPRGVDAAVDVLRRATILINRILDDFDSWSAGRLS